MFRMALSGKYCILGWLCQPKNVNIHFSGVLEGSVCQKSLKNIFLVLWMVLSAKIQNNFLRFGTVLKIQNNLLVFPDGSVWQKSQNIWCLGMVLSAIKSK